MVGDLRAPLADPAALWASTCVSIVVCDILWFYSLAGFALLAFRNLQPRTILIWAAVFLLLPIPFYAACYSIAPGYNTDNWVPNAIDLPTLMRLVPTAGYLVALGLNLEGFLFEVKSKFFG